VTTTATVRQREMARIGQQPAVCGALPQGRAAIRNAVRPPRATAIGSKRWPQIDRTHVLGAW